MTKSLSNVRVYGDEAGAVHVGPKGSTLPEDLAALAAPLEETGWINEDGVNIATEQDVSKFYAWQGGRLLRSKTTTSSDSFTFTAAEENPTVLGLYLPKSTTEVTGVAPDQVAKITPAGGISSDERAFVIDLFDGDVQKRYCVIRGEVSERGEVPHQNSEMTTYTFTVDVYEYYILTNNPAFLVTP